MATPQGDFIWYELMTTDSAAAAGFYSAVVGWNISPAAADSEPEYRLIVRDDGGNAGGVLRLTREMRDGGAVPVWLPYLYSADVDRTLKAIEAEGGRVLMPQNDLPVGRIAMVADPQDVPIYVMNPVPPEGAADSASEVFSTDALQRVGWNELESPDLSASKDFYARHFGFEFNEVMDMGDMGEYCFIDHNGRRLGGIMQRQDASHQGGWLLYFQVPSVAAAKVVVKAEGGTVTSGPMEVPGGSSIIVATDPQGARFGLVSAGA